MRFLEKANSDFIGKRKLAYYISLTVLTIGLASIIVRGFQLGIDFKGGTEVVIGFARPIDISKIRSTIYGEGFSGQIKEYGSPREIILTTDFKGDLNELQATLTRILTRDFKDNPHEILRIDSVGPSIADDLRSSAISALLGALAMILLYVGIRS